MKSILALTWEELEALDHEKTVVFLPVAPVEEHGRHLPLGVDIFLTERWQCDTIALIEADGPECLVLPVLPLGFADIRGFNGNLHISKSLLWELICQSLVKIAGWGFRNIVVLSGHADPLHLVTIEHACSYVNERFGTVAFAPMGALLGGQGPVDGTIQEHPRAAAKRNEFPHDFHAGWIETSAMLAIAPSLVMDLYREMPDVAVTPREMADVDLVARRIEGYGHIGAPRLADTETGAVMLEDMARNLHHTISLFIRRRGFEPYAHHVLYPVLSRLTEEEQKCIQSDSFH